MTFLQCKDFLTSPDFCTLGVGRYAIKIKRPPLGLGGGYVGAKKWLFHVLKGRSPGCRYKFATVIKIFLVTVAVSTHLHVLCRHLILLIVRPMVGQAVSYNNFIVVQRWCYMRRFSMMIFSTTQHCNIVVTLFQILTTLFQLCNDVLSYNNNNNNNNNNNDNNLITSRALFTFTDQQRLTN